ncbi:MAG: Ig-like domain-containing protein [Bacteroidales bacterium]|nr:Ig-like domain-containing protein [Bacteroidales bacterium]
MKSFGRYIFSAILALSVFAGCEEEVAEPVLLEIDRTNMKMTVGQSQKLNASLKGAEGDFVWESDTPEVASVDAEGLVVALAAGKANVIVTAGGVSKTCAVEVIDFTAAKLELNSDFTKENGSNYSHLILKGETLKLEPKFYNGDGEKVNEMAYPKYAVTISNPSKQGETVVSVNEDGVVEAINPGYATVRISGAGLEAFVALTVKSMELASTEMTMFVNQSNFLVATIYPEDLPESQKLVEWVSYSTDFVKVNNKGVATALKPTTEPVIVAAQCGDLTAECKISVTEYTIDAVVLSALDGLKAADGTYQMLVGDNPYDLAVKFQKNGEDVTDMVKNLAVTVGYTSSNTEVATIENGIISVKKAGTTDITVNCAGKTASFTLNVIQCVESVQIISPEANPYVIGNDVESFTIQYAVYPENASVKTATFSSNAPEVASVDAKTGVVTVHKPGDAQITVTTDGMMRPYVNQSGATVVEPATVNLVLVVSDESTKPSVEIGGEGVNDGVLTIKKGNQVQLKANVTPASYSGSLTWSTTTSNILSVDAKTGLLTALARGTGKVVAVAGGAVAELTVNVLGIDPTAIKIDQEFAGEISVSEKQLLLTASVTAPDNGDFGGVNWYTSNESVATVNSEGQVSIHKAGTVTITAKALSADGTKELSNVTASITLNFIAPEISEVMVAATKSMVEEGESFQLTYQVIPSEAEPKNVMWTMEDGSDLASITSSGVITGIKSERVTDAVTGVSSWRAVTVKVTVDGVSATGQVAIIPRQPSGIELDVPQNNQLKVEQAWNFNPRVLPSDLSGFSIGVYSSPYGAMTNAYGAFAPEEPGSYELTFYTESNTNLVYQRQRSVSISVLPYWVQSISIPSTYELEEGGSAILVAEFTSDVAGKEPYDKTVKWTSMDESVVKVDGNGKITAVAPGTAEVKVTTNGSWSVPSDQQPKTASCMVTVKGAENVIKVGDYYYSDGTTSSSIVAGKTIVGIVISRDNAKSTDVKLPNDCTHGLVLALGQGEGNWSSSYDAGKVNTWALANGYQNTTGVYYSAGSYVTNDYGKRLLGYNNTSALRGYIAKYGYTSGIVAALDAYAATVTLPASASEMYIPSIAEMQLIHNNFEVINAALEAAGGTTFVRDPYDNQKDLYWTTSENESSSGNAAALNPFSGQLHGGVLKGSGIKKVRYIFAF